MKENPKAIAMLDELPADELTAIHQDGGGHISITRTEKCMEFCERRLLA